jgi:predicted nuclease with RNAse H fold
MVGHNHDAFWVGADPGGAERFGIALLYQDGRVVADTVSCADEAVAKIAAHPLGAGVDSPLWWSSGLSAGRKADQWIRDTHKIHPGTVQSANSLRGAALVQGQMFVHRLRDKFPDVRVTEAHPKAAAIALGGWNGDKITTLYSYTSEPEHVRDAILAAVAAREGFESRWTHDLSMDRYICEQDPKSYWLGPVSYFWPF